MLRGYRHEWLRFDIGAGLSVAAVALPTAIAYAQLAGFPPVVGLYAAMARLGPAIVLGPVVSAVAPMAPLLPALSVLA